MKKNPTELQANFQVPNLSLDQATWIIGTVTGRIPN